MVFDPTAIKNGEIVHKGIVSSSFLKKMYERRIMLKMCARTNHQPTIYKSIHLCVCIGKGVEDVSPPEWNVT